MVFPCSICKGEKRACHIDLRHEGCFECASRGHECCLDPDLDMMLKINRKLNYQLGMLDMFRGVATGDTARFPKVSPTRNARNWSS